ncbi:GHKL domain-containing protein [Lentimicrobium sp. L6]|uniref:PocR ligand-binding domain-containing protein n=1 Tax=Lentimicrobium sp. L6 TaxID=2735916 RepID=UPI0015579803|nr:PocR ligand-binding domain-containing protein [Lentimicrobium sp. L6]NPD87032.1 GHKL domain-containing protein [Lentimicrobium sp. L6]
MLNEKFLNIEFTDLIDIETIQRFQDSFSDATGVASVITKPDGTPITKPSNFCSLCLLIRKTKKGLSNCYNSDAVIGRQNQEGPIYQKCLSGGLWDGGASISVDGKHIANWLIGQVLNKDSDEKRILKYAKEIGADENEFKNELQKVTRMPLEQFKKVVNSLFIFANELSDKAYQNLQLKIHQEHLEILVKEKTEELEAAIEELRATNEELHDKSEIINKQNQSLKTTLNELKEAQAQLIQSEKMASLGILTAGVAHEINNPLNYIMGAYVGLNKIHSQKSYQDNSETLSVLIDSLKTGVDRAANIVTGLNYFSRNSKSLNEDCEIHSIIDNCLTMLHNQTKHRISVKKDYCDSEILITGNSGKLHQVFLNVLSNAVQAIHQKGEITIGTKTTHDNIEVTVKDNGEGISSENLKKITDPFFTTKQPGKGTGLGLSICYNIIKEHKGELSFKSKLGKGTTVIISLSKTT